MDFETVRPGLLRARHVQVGKEEWDALAPDLHARLLQLQLRLAECDFPLILVLSGEDRPGVAALVARIAAWLDPRHVEVHALGAPTDEEREQPPLWRFWRVLPKAGATAVFVGGWTADAVVRAAGGADGAPFRADLAHVVATERAWVAGGAVLAKFWLDVPAQQLAERVDEERERRFARLDELDWALATDPAAQRLAAEALELTGTEDAPWHVVESRSERRRDAVVLGRLAELLQQRIERSEREEPAATAPLEPAPRAADAPTLAEGAEAPRDDPPDYDERLDELQARLGDLTRCALLEGLSSVVVFEGVDAAGKGGAIRRVVAALDPLCYRVSEIAAPSDEEAAHHWLWRFWTRLARPGRLSIFDRSWYGRVLVERVEGFASEREWRSAYREIVDFEAELARSGRLVHKLWLHVEPDVQLERFRAREQDPLKQHKITPDDWRNRAKAPQYAEAAEEMLARTHRPDAPWQVVAAASKKAARLAVLEALVGRYEKAFEARRAT